MLAPRYSMAEAVRFIPGLSRTLLRSWVRGRSRPIDGRTGCPEPIIGLSNPGEPMLSFTNLVEAHVLSGLRRTRGISIPDLRTAIEYAERRHGITHLLAHRDVWAAAGELFLDHYGELVNLTTAGQLAMREVLDAYLRRLRHGKTGLAVSLSPILPWAPDRQDYVIDPAIAYGRPVIAKHGVPVEVVANRINGGETISTLARDYDLERAEIKAALAYAEAA